MKIKFWVRANGMYYTYVKNLPSKADFSEVHSELYKFEQEFEPEWFSKPTYFKSGFEVIKKEKRKKNEAIR